MREAGAFYEAPRDAQGRRTGPLVGYAGKDAEGRQYVGDIYVNFARAERRPALLQVFARRLLDLARSRGIDIDGVAGFIGAPEGGKAFAYQLALEAGKGYIYPEKKIIAAASATARESSDMVFSRHEPEPGERWFIVEDVCNNFSTTAKLVAEIEGYGASVAGILCFLNRSETVGQTYEPRPGQVLPVVAVVQQTLRAIRPGRPRGRRRHRRPQRRLVAQEGLAAPRRRDGGPQGIGRTRSSPLHHASRGPPPPLREGGLRPVPPRLRPLLGAGDHPKGGGGGQ